jgi:VanZ family protein
VTRVRYGALWLAFAALVAYLSFVPFRYQPVDLDQALARFQRLPLLSLDAGSRADWVANILLYLPLGWLAAAFFVPRPRHAAAILAVVPAALLGSAWAVAVEFGQLYFPGRTASVNDIVAEVLGSWLGAWLWIVTARHWHEWWRRLLRGGRATADAVVAGYVVVYLILSFSPFDVVVSAREIAHKLASGMHGWWLAPVGCGRAPCSLKLASEVVAVIPFGWWWAARRRDAGGSVASAALAGCALGVIIEGAQLLLVSGITQGASVVARTVGMAVGAILWTQGGMLAALDIARYGRAIVLVALLPYLASVAYVSGWTRHRWVDIDTAWGRLGEVAWIPFFYQYFTTEQDLIRSTVVHLVMYAPVGVGVWLWRRGKGAGTAWLAAATAGVLACVAEAGKLFVPPKHPDYTDVLLAGLAAWTSATLLGWVWSHRGGVVGEGLGEPPVGSGGGPGGSTWRDTVPTEVVPDELGGEPADQTELKIAGTTARSWPAAMAGLVLVLVVVVSVAGFPVWRMPLAIGLIGYALVLMRRPMAYLLVLPAALPVLDLAPWSGRFFWDEFDMLLTATLAMRLMMPWPPRRASPPLPKAGLWLLGASVIASTVIGVWPLAPLDANAFSSYLSPYNALRVAKGYAWGGALLWLAWRDAAAGRPVTTRLQLGLGLGLVAAAFSVWWERALFVGAGDLGTWFRAAGFLSATHVGGAYMEAILVALTPFGLALAVGARRVWHAAVWYAVVLVAGCAVLMTLSRAALAAWLLAIAIFAVAWYLTAMRPRATTGEWGWRWGAVVVLAGLVALTAAAARSTYVVERLRTSSPDMIQRVAHWRDTIQLMRRDPLHLVLGMGLGSFPREFHAVKAATQQLPSYRLARDERSGVNYLALNGGRSMYMDQKVAAKPGSVLRLTGLIRSSPAGGGLSISLCEKSFLNSTYCSWANVSAAPTWRPFEARLVALSPPSRGMVPTAPMSLTLHNGAFGSRVEVTDLSLSDGRQELLSNGSFGEGLDHWFMFSDVHREWRVLSTPLQIAFEQGALGLLASVSLAISAIGAVLRGGLVPRATAGFFGAGASLVAVGCFDSLLDAPRLIMAAALVLAAGLLCRGCGRHGAETW